MKALRLSRNARLAIVVNTREAARNSAVRRFSQLRNPVTVAARMRKPAIRMARPASTLRFVEIKPRNASRPLVVRPARAATTWLCNEASAAQRTKNPFQSQSESAKVAAVVKITYWAGIDCSNPRPAPIAAISPASASPIQRSGRTIGAVRDVKRELSAMFLSRPKLGNERVGVHEEPDPQHAPDSNRCIKERCHPPLVRLPDQDAKRHDDGKQEDCE